MNYVFIHGSGEENFKEFKKDFIDKSSELEDIQKLKRLHALNYIIKYGGVIEPA
ncbi:hypothetical protein KW820_22775 [Enterobacter quasiroggenkampii]|nr:hypothetical protein [Enterobacter quasiroggenkampii]